MLQTLSHPLLMARQLQLKNNFSWCRQGQTRANLSTVEGTALKLVLLLDLLDTERKKKQNPV